MIKLLIKVVLGTLLLPWCIGALLITAIPTIIFEDWEFWRGFNDPIIRMLPWVIIMEYYKS